MSHAILTPLESTNDQGVEYPLYGIARVIADTNQPGQFVRANRSEKERRLKEADAVILYLINKGYLKTTLLYK